MFRIIRWLCFPIARRLRVWPIMVYYVLAAILIGLRWSVFPPSEEMMAYLPVWLFSALYGFFLVGFPLLMVIFNRGWFKVPARRSTTG